MTAVLPARTPSVPRATSGQVVRAIARPEALRLLRHPLLWIGTALSLTAGYLTFQAPPEWTGARYQAGPVDFGPLLVAISMVVAGTFHRERAGLAPEAPVDEASRAGGRLLGAGVLVALVLAFAVAWGVTARLTGGDSLGDEPGRVLHAHYTLPELLQPIALAFLAVGVGAAAGRRFRHRATAYLVLFVGWFPFVMVSWAFMDRRVTPFSLIQIQPVSIPVGPPESDPRTFPTHWLLSGPGEYQTHWAREFVSARLAAGHDLWLVGLACLFLSLALPTGWRGRIAGVGLALAVVGVAAQYLVIP